MPDLVSHASVNDSAELGARNPRTDLRAIAAMLGATMLWGATFVVIRDSLHRITPAALVATRFALAAVLLLPIAWSARRRAFGPALWKAGAICGFVTGASFLCQAIGLTETSAGSSAFLTCAGTLMAGVFAWPLLGQRPSRAIVIGMVLAATGVALLSRHPGVQLGPGDRWTLAGALGFGLQVVALARWAPGMDPLALGAAQSAIAALVLLPFAAGAPAQLAALGAEGWARLGYLVIAGTVAAPLLQILAQRTLPAGRIGMLFALEPLFALLFALGIGGERFGPRWWIGAALIVFAVTWVESHAVPPPASSRAPT